MAVIAYDLKHCRVILEGLRKIRELQPERTPEIDAIICLTKHHFAGKLSKLEPFMRNREWILQEIAYEENQHAIEFHDCPNCKDNNKEGLCRGKFCADCWKEMLTMIHGIPEHDEVSCKKA